MTVSATDDELDLYWRAARAACPELPAERPDAWGFGATPQHADELLALVLSGTKTATASALWDYEAEGEALPAPGRCDIVLDGAGAPRAVIETTSVRVLPFDEVDEAHAHAEGEDDRTLRSWREIHRRFWTEYGARGFAPDMPVVCERFRVIFR